MPALTREEFDALTALKCGIAYNQYGGYCVPASSSHRVAARAILSNHVYEPKTIEFLTSNWKTGDIVHAGTYFGDFLPALSSACPSEAKIWAFEPNHENFRCAQITSLINGIDNVELTHAGLGDLAGKAVVRVADESGRSLGGLSEILHGDGCERAGHKEEVSIVTIDGMLPAERAVSIIQLDVEGFEEQALAGGLATIRKFHPLIVLEVLQGRGFVDGTWFIDNILGIGYIEVGSAHGNAIFACPDTNPPESLRKMSGILTKESIARL